MNKRKGINSKKDPGIALSPLDIPTRSELTRAKAYNLIFTTIVLFFIFGIAILAINLGHTIASSASILPDVKRLEDHKPSETTLIYDVNDNLVANIHGDEDRVVVPLKNISQNLQKAVLSTEDDTFYEHKGINIKGIVRAMLTNFSSGDSVQGGSTITQQLVKNFFLSPDRTFQRKIAEAILAVKVENYYSKDKILELYLNQVYWGNRSYGIEKAARRYFNVAAKDLNLAQASLLAGLLKAPSDYSPYTNFDRSKARQKVVLGKMLKDGFITQSQYDNAVNYKLNFTPSVEKASKYSYFVTYVISELEKKYGKDVVRRGGLRVYTTINPVAQEIAEKVIKNNVNSIRYSGVKQGALVSIDVKTGYIQAIVGGVDFEKSNFNRATQSKRALGSTFKPIVYLTAFAKGILTPDSKIQDAPITISDGWSSWSPHNWDGRYMGTLTARKALYLSRNTPTVRLAQKLGIDAIIDMAQKLGIKEHLDPNLSIALGSAGVPPIEIATVFSTIARGGVYIEPIFVRRIEDSQGKVLEVYEPHPNKVVDSNAVNTLISILVDVVEKGTGKNAKLSDRVVAGKTGTTDEMRDIWFVGFTPDTVTAVWMGNDANKPLHGVFSSNCAKAWRDFSKEFYSISKLPPLSFVKPTSLNLKNNDPLAGFWNNAETVTDDSNSNSKNNNYTKNSNTNDNNIPKFDKIENASGQTHEAPKLDQIPNTEPSRFKPDTQTESPEDPENPQE